ncbi:MAG: type II toxin-antitoxin system RelE/ParE family toxin [Candidatus Omnitrophica bacterium]|nr:type II toxin-antitoxin system RelE/ParE family toxin [Candidatus Omnitrophota bacterium]MBU4502876.1 type II toxin-antitoxin system RelE/ParE family toxin [Nanoarchaeota archaeon]
MSYNLFYHPEIKKESLPSIPVNMKERIKRAIEERLLTGPERYGEPLKRGLQGYRKLRAGDYRVVYKVSRENIIILKIGHRKEVYRKACLRIKNLP